MNPAKVCLLIFFEGGLSVDERYYSRNSDVGYCS